MSLVTAPVTLTRYTYSSVATVSTFTRLTTNAAGDFVSVPVPTTFTRLSFFSTTVTSSRAVYTGPRSGGDDSDFDDSGADVANRLALIIGLTVGIFFLITLICLGFALYKWRRIKKWQKNYVANAQKAAAANQEKMAIDAVANNGSYGQQQQGVYQPYPTYPYGAPSPSPGPGSSSHAPSMPTASATPPPPSPHVQPVPPAHHSHT